MAELDVPRLTRNTRLPEQQRAKVGQQLAREYNAGKSIREICQESGYSIGRVRRLLDSAGVTYRSRGGSARATSER